MHEPLWKLPDIMRSVRCDEVGFVAFGQDMLGIVPSKVFLFIITVSLYEKSRSSSDIADDSGFLPGNTSWSAMPDWREWKDTFLWTKG